MELKEMNDMTEPLLHNKDLEAEALRLQIGLRDRMVEEHNELIREASHSPIALPKGWLHVPQRDSARGPVADPYAIAAADKVLGRVDEDCDEFENSLGTSSGSRHHFEPSHHSRSHSRDRETEAPASGSTPPPPPIYPYNGSRPVRDEAHKPTGSLPPLPPGPRGRPADRVEPPARSRTPVGVALPDIRFSGRTTGAEARPRSLPFDGGPYAVRQAPSAVKEQKARAEEDSSGRRSSDAGDPYSAMRGLGAKLGCREPYRIPRSRRRKQKKASRKDPSLFRSYLQSRTVPKGQGPVPTLHAKPTQAYGEYLDRTQLHSGGVGAKDERGAPSSASADPQGPGGPKVTRASRLDRLNRKMKTRPESLE